MCVEITVSGSLTRPCHWPVTKAAFLAHSSAPPHQTLLLTLIFCDFTLPAAPCPPAGPRRAPAPPPPAPPLPRRRLAPPLPVARTRPNNSPPRPPSPVTKPRRCVAALAPPGRPPALLRARMAPSLPLPQVVQLHRAHPAPAPAPGPAPTPMPSRSCLCNHARGPSRALSRGHGRRASPAALVSPPPLTLRRRRIAGHAHALALLSPPRTPPTLRTRRRRLRL